MEESEDSNSSEASLTEMAIDKDRSSISKFEEKAKLKS